MLPPALPEPAPAIAAALEAGGSTLALDNPDTPFLFWLKARGETLAIAESSAGGLISAALVAVPGASAFYRGGLVIYTLKGAKELLAGVAPLEAGVRSA